MNSKLLKLLKDLDNAIVVTVGNYSGIKTDWQDLLQRVREQRKELDSITNNWAA